jgi:arylsulfatase A-like enzyme
VRLEGRGAQAPESVEGYFAAITGIDDQFGRLLSCLDEEGLSEDTIVIFSADHGEMMGSHGEIGKNNWYEESMRIPFLVRWPGRVRSGMDDLLFGGADVSPTLLGLAGLADEVPPQVQGTDYSPILLGQQMHRPTSALYLYVENEHPELGRRGVRTHRHTFVRIRRPGEEEEIVLHDNQADPFQLRNFAPESSELVEELSAELDRWLERTGDPWRRG